MKSDEIIFVPIAHKDFLWKTFILNLLKFKDQLVVAYCLQGQMLFVGKMLALVTDYDSFLKVYPQTSNFQ